MTAIMNYVITLNALTLYVSYHEFDIILSLFSWINSNQRNTHY